MYISVYIYIYIREEVDKYLGFAEGLLHDAFSEDGLPILRLLRLQSAWGLRFEVEGLEFWVEEVGSGIEGSRFRIECALFSGPGQ